MKEGDRDMAMVFQNYALYPHMTVYENMSFGLRLKRYPKDEIARRVQEAAGILDITELLSTHIHGTSVPVEEPSTASGADICECYRSAVIYRLNSVS